MADVVPRDTVEHYLLHSLLRHAERDGINYLPLSEMAGHLHANTYDEVAMALETLIDWGVVERTSTRRGEGFVVNKPCGCAPTRNEQRNRNEQLKRSSNETRPGTRGGTSAGKESFNAGISDQPPARNRISDSSFDELILRDHNRLTDFPSSGEVHRNRAGLKSSHTATSPHTGTEDAHRGIRTHTEWRGLPGNIVSGRITQKRGRPADPDSPWGLAQVFQDRCDHLELKLYPVNRGALVKAFAEWKKDGVSAERIRLMIGVFRPESHQGGSPAWKLFLGQRQALFERTLFRHEGRPDTEEFWMGTNEERPDTLEYWFGEDAWLHEDK